MTNQYYEGILQLRNVSRELINFVKKQAKNENVIIAKVVKQRNGLDFYVSSRKFLHKIGKMLQKNFTGQLKVSPRLFSRNRQTSKNIYRVNVMFKLCPYKKGDIIEHMGEKVEIVNISNKILVKAGGKKRWIKFEDVF
jgi:NMD protein affecting ribosome stability and mRNA decay